MVVVGGLSGFSGDASAWAEKDEWPNGLGVFDLTALRWLDGYDADAGNYTSPDSVREWYNKGYVSRERTSLRWSPTNSHNSVAWTTSNGVAALLNAFSVSYSSRPILRSGRD